jgi:hypothetical protein
MARIAQEPPPIDLIEAAIDPIVVTGCVDAFSTLMVSGAGSES